MIRPDSVSKVSIYVSDKKFLKVFRLERDRIGREKIERNVIGGDKC